MSLPTPLLAVPQMERQRSAGMEPTASLTLGAEPVHDTAGWARGCDRTKASAPPMLGGELLEQWDDGVVGG